MIPLDIADIRQDVSGDYEAARRAAIAMRQAAAALDGARARRRVLATIARDTWSGRFARQFDARLEALERELVDLQAQLAEAARRLDLAADDAAWDQRARVAAREEVKATGQ